MEKIINWLSDLITFRLSKYYFSLFLLIGSLSSCFQKFYKTNTVATTDSATLHKLVAENKTFILHTPEGPVAVKNAVVSSDSFSGDKDVLNPESDKYLNPVAYKPNRLNMKKSEVVLNEVHLYTKSSFPGNGKVNLDINQIYRIDVYGFDKKATRDSRMVSIFCITVGVGAVVVVVAIFANGMGHMMDGFTINMH
jgi:ABC-type antimicrobial peptide transport system permease subunit